MTSIGLLFLISDLLDKNPDVVSAIKFFLVYVAIDIVIFIVQFFLGEYAKVTLEEDGFTYRKHFAPKFVSWEKVYAVEEVTPYLRNINYYLLKVQDGKQYREYLIEKNICTWPMMERLYFKKSGNEEILRLPFQGKQRFDFFTNVIAGVILPCLYAASFEHIGKISINTMMWLISADLIVAALVTAVYLYKKSDSRFTANQQRLTFKVNGREYTVNWDEAKKISRERVHLGRSHYEILTVELAEDIAGKYDTIEVPVRQRFVEKLGEQVKIVIK